MEGTLVPIEEAPFFLFGHRCADITPLPSDETAYHGKLNPLAVQMLAGSEASARKSDRL